ncbi:MAG: stage III sporulation protein AB [Eubacteriales bacterium]|nr:stage III sporulation protein AB [Eubacteriales bacterium]
MLRWGVGFLAFLACCLLGYRRALYFQRRQETLLGACDLIEHLERGVKSARVTLPSMLAEFAAQQHNGIGDLCAAVSSAWDSGAEEPLENIWQRETEKLTAHGLAAEDMQLIAWIGTQALWGFPGEFFSAARRAIADRQQAARQECEKKGRLAKALGALCGALAFILVI